MAWLKRLKTRVKRLKAGVNMIKPLFKRKNSELKNILKFYDDTAWLTNNCNTHVAQYFEMSDFVSYVSSQ